MSTIGQTPVSFKTAAHSHAHPGRQTHRHAQTYTQDIHTIQTYWSCPVILLAKARCLQHAH